MGNDREKTTKYMLVADHFKRVIRSGDIKNGEQLPTENEIAEKFQVSRHTVRQALVELEKGGFIYKEQGKGTFCAYKGVKSEKKTVAVITTYISNYIFPSIISGIEEVLSASGYTLILFNTNNEKQKERECLERIMEYGVEGLIIEPTISAQENVNIDMYQELIKKGIPYVMINAKYESLQPAYLVMDDIGGGYALTRYLLQLGHREIAGIFKCDDIQGADRQQGYIKALTEFGVKAHEAYIGHYTTKENTLSPYEFAYSLLKRVNKPSAFVCYNDQIAVSVLQAIREVGLKVPEDISIVGYDDSYMATATEVKLTTIRHPKDEMGRRAARFLITMMQGREEKPLYVYQPELIVRSSAKSL